MTEAFEYYHPYLIDDVFSLLIEGSRIYAGGTDLIVQLRSDKIGANRIIDIKNIKELSGITEENEYISVGAACTLSEIAENTLIHEYFPALVSACLSVGSPQIQNKGTIGGNICNASPSGDTLNALLAYGATVKLKSSFGDRVLKLEEFIIAPGKIKLLNGELLQRILIPKKIWSNQRFFKVGKRNALAISVVNGTVLFEYDMNGEIEDTRIALGAVAPTPVRIYTAENILIGKNIKLIDSEILENVVEATENTIKPITDVRASYTYRKYIAGVYVKRIINEFINGGNVK